MTTTHLAFGKAHSDQAQALTQLRLAESAFHFVKQGLQDSYAPRQLASVGTLELLVKSKLLEAATGGGLIPVGSQLAKTWHKNAWPVAMEQSLRALLDAFAASRTHFFGPIAPPWLGLGDSEREAQIGVQICGVAPVDEPNLPNPLEQAYAMAEYNKLRCEQRSTLLYVLANVGRNGHGQLQHEAAETELNTASAQLWAAHSLQVKRMLALGTLLEGEFLQRNKQLVKAMYGEGMAVIDMLQVDGHVPGRWPSALDDDFRKAVAAA